MTAFDFGKWINDNELNQVKELLIKHKMIKLNALNTKSNEYKNLMCDKQLTLMYSQYIPKIVDSINKIETFEMNDDIKINENKKKYHCNK